MPFLADGELVEHQPVVSLRVLEVDQGQPPRGGVPVGPARLNRHAFDHELVQPVVFGACVLRFGALYLFEGCFYGCGALTGV